MESVIKQVLDKTGMSQKELAEALNVTSQAVSNWVRGKSRPSSDNIERIYQLTGLNIVEMSIKCSKRTMTMKKLSEIDTYSKAKEEANEILQTADIRAKYSYAVYKLCTLLVPAVICLTHHQMLNPPEGVTSDEIGYDWIFTNLLDYIGDFMNPVPGLYENGLEYGFYLMGMDLFESFDEYMIPDHEYCQDAMRDFYLFESVLKKDNSSPVYNEFLVAILDITELE